MLRRVTAATLLLVLLSPTVRGEPLSEEDRAQLPCNALCRRWMGSGPETDIVGPALELHPAVLANPEPGPEQPLAAGQAAGAAFQEPPVAAPAPRLAPALPPPRPRTIAGPAHAPRRAVASAPLPPRPPATWRRPAPEPAKVAVADPAPIHALPLPAASPPPPEPVATVAAPPPAPVTPPPAPAFVLPVLEAVTEPAPRPAATRHSPMPPPFDVIGALLLSPARPGS